MMSDRGKKSKVIPLEDTLGPIQGEWEETRSYAIGVGAIAEENRQELNDCIIQAKQLAAEMGVSIPISNPSEPSEVFDLAALDQLPASEASRLSLLNYKINEYRGNRAGASASLSPEDVVFSAFAGLLAAVIDVIFVGTPEIVKVYRGKERFDGSILTGALRRLGNSENGDLVPALKWLSEKCKVPYDISSVKGVVTPNNHRLRSFAHDPVLGLFFAVVDIIMGTTTCIDGQGRLTILINKNPASMPEKLFPVLFYIGHILSDLCTARGVPIPGMFLTQFFVDGGSEDSIARIAERMYQDGYDMRHLVSMSVPVWTKTLLTDAYLSLTKASVSPLLPVAEKERLELDHAWRREKMLFISNSIATAGNLVKFIAPPNCGNPCALNVSQWAALAINSIHLLIASQQDHTAEKVMDNRQAINKKWAELIADD